jgi:hypothetical protein
MFTCYIHHGLPCEYISSYFASLHSSAHWKVFKLDKAIQKQAGSVNNVSLNKFDILRAAIFVDMTPAKAVLSPNRKQARSLELQPIGDKLTHAIYGTMEHVRRKHLCVNTGTFAKIAEDPTVKLIVLEEKSAALE